MNGFVERPGQDFETDEELELLEELIDLVVNVGCLVCRKNFARDQIHILARHDQAWLVVAYCESCDAHQLVVMMVHDRDQDRPTPDPVGDLSWKEWQEVSTLAPISTRDVHDVEHLLESYQGDLISLLEDH